jgi:hypothetical protein
MLERADVSAGVSRVGLSLLPRPGTTGYPLLAAAPTAAIAVSAVRAHSSFLFRLCKAIKMRNAANKTGKAYF